MKKYRRLIGADIGQALSLFWDVSGCQSINQSITMISYALQFSHNTIKTECITLKLINEPKSQDILTEFDIFERGKYRAGLRRGW